MSTVDESLTADPRVFADPAVREAITLLRDYGVTTNQYATVALTETWKVDGREFPDRARAFGYAQQSADRTGQLVEVWRCLGEEADWAAESWIIKPEEFR